MIASVRGTLAFVGPDHVVVDVQGVGYELLVPGSTRAGLPRVGEAVTLYTAMQVREDALVLFGFLTAAERQLFRMLLGVNGIGSKAALNILSGTTPERFHLAIAFEDVAALTRLPGVGKKTAQRLILELREKIGFPPGDATGDAALAGAGAAPPPYPVGEAVEALAALGYSRAEAAAAINAAAAELGAAGVGSDGTGAGGGPRLSARDLVRQALRHLGRTG